MKKFTFLGMIITISLVSSGMKGAIGQGMSFDQIQTIMEVTSENGNLPAAIDDPGANRGAAFNGEHVFVASRINGLHIYYWDVNDPGATPQELDMTGVSGGYFPINEVTTAGEQIFASNMDFAGGTFRMYHWSNVDATPTLLIEYASTPARLGDAFTVIGDPEVGAAIVVSGYGSKNVYVWYTEEGELESAEPAVFSMDDLENVNFCRATATVGNDDDWYSLLSGPFGVAVLDEEANIELIIPQSFFPGWSMYAQPFFYEGKRYLSYIHVRIGEVIENILYVLEIDDGQDLLVAMTNLSNGTFADHVVHSFNLGSVSNGNASVSNDVVIDPFGNLWLMGFAAGNGFVVQKLGDAFMYTLPFVENFEGEGVETPLDWLPEGWLNIDADGDTYKWVWEDNSDDESDPYETYMVSRSRLIEGEGTSLTPDNWLITPQILLDDIVDGETIEMNFHVAPTSTENSQERYEILISTTDTETESFTIVWEETLGPDDLEWVWLPRNLDLTYYAGQSVHVAIRHFGSSDLDGIAIEKLEIVKVRFVPEVADLTLNVRMVVWADEDKFDPDNDFVDVAGTFNNWGDDPLILTASDDEYLTYNITIPDLAIGGEYEFKFRINGSWSDETAEFPFGAPGRMVTIQETGNEYTFWYNDNQPTFVGDLSAGQFRVFPNPVSSFLNITADERINFLVVNDITGRKIQEIAVNNFEASINVSNYQSGIYLIAIHTEKGISFKKIQVKK